MERKILPSPASFIEVTPPEIESRIITAPEIPAFFIAAGKPLKVIPYKTPSGMVEFKIEGTKIDEAMADFYADTEIGVSTYVRALKGLRSAIFSLKGPKQVAGR